MPMDDYSNASNYSIQPGVAAKPRQGIGLAPTDDAHMATHQADPGAGTDVLRSRMNANYNSPGLRGESSYQRDEATDIEDSVPRGK